MAIIYGTPGNDSKIGQPSNDIFYLYEGNDTAVGAGGIDTMFGNSENDRLDAYTSTAVYAYGGQGNDTVLGANASGDNIYGEVGLDTLFGYGGNDNIQGGDGGDRIYGNQGNDSIFGNANSDVIYGGDGADIVWGGQTNDVIYGELGNDYIQGEADNDAIYGGQGNDWLQGNSGSDQIDALYGYDTIYYENSGLSNNPDTDYIYNFEGNNFTSGDRILNLSGLAGVVGSDLVIGYLAGSYPNVTFVNRAVLIGRADLVNAWSSQNRAGLSRKNPILVSSDGVTPMSEIDPITGEPAEFDNEAFLVRSIEALEKGEPLPQDPNVIWLDSSQVTVSQLQEALFLTRMTRASMATPEMQTIIAIQDEERKNLMESGMLDALIPPPGSVAPIPEIQPLPFGMYYRDPNTLANPTLEALEKQYGQPIPVSELNIQPGSTLDFALQTYIATGEQPEFGFPDPTGSAPERALQTFVETFSNHFSEVM
ncbi:MAG TPA: calcium-binding protein [Oscillatoriales cyanobacterium M4454_W2019_049]|nr:calcium-binding protein [Oscillatoriales cyanobacterium M4454_W2019_049]